MGASRRVSGAFSHSSGVRGTYHLRFFTGTYGICNRNIIVRGTIAFPRFYRGSVSKCQFPYLKGGRFRSARFVSNRFHLLPIPNRYHSKGVRGHTFVFRSVSQISRKVNSTRSYLSLNRRCIRVGELNGGIVNSATRNRSRIRIVHYKKSRSRQRLKGLSSFLAPIGTVVG